MPTLTLELTEEQAAGLRRAAAFRGMTPEALAQAAIAGVAPPARAEGGETLSQMLARWNAEDAADPGDEAMWAEFDRALGISTELPAGTPAEQRAAAS